MGRRPHFTSTAAALSGLEVGKGITTVFHVEPVATIVDTLDTVLVGSFLAGFGDIGRFLLSLTGRRRGGSSSDGCSRGGRQGVFGTTAIPTRAFRETLDHALHLVS